MELSSIISVSGTIIGALVLLVVAFKYRRNNYQKFLFLLFIFSLTYTCFLIFLTESGWILVYPHFYRTASPLIYTAPIAFYLLGVAVGRNQDRASWTTLLWFAIPILHFVELIPFFLEDARDKVAFLNTVATDPDLMVSGRISLIPNSWHFDMQLGLGVVLMGIMFFKTLKYRQRTRNSSRISRLIWLNRVSLFLAISNAVILLLLNTDTENHSAYSYGALLYAISLLIIFISLFMEPSILYGTSAVRKKQRPSRENPASDPQVISMAEQVFKNNLERYFREESGYLDPDFRQQDLADYLGITRNELSHKINSVYQQNFNQLLNEKRIEVALRNLDSSQWENLSLQGVAREVGFKSRTTFNKAFKMKTGVTPSEYKTA